jgi:hypothetical protein
MAGATVEVKYFNSFVLKKTNQASHQPIWNGSMGIPSDKGGYPVVSAGSTDNANNWAIEEARIRGGYNNTSTSYGAKAYLVEEEPNAYVRFNALIYSGIFNSKTGVNDTNVFSTGQSISKATDPANGSIQKLYAEDTNLIILQENKVSRALIDKDAIYSAEGQGVVTSSRQVIGVIQPFGGKFGISKNPQSFAVYGHNKYFADKNNNVILRLSNGGLQPISSAGMRDFFRDELNSIDVSEQTGMIIGGWDLYNSQYVISTQQPSNQFTHAQLEDDPVVYNTLSWDDSIEGWTSLYDYRPDQMFSLKNNFYSLSIDLGTEHNEYKLWKHYSTTVNRGKFYGVDYDSDVTFIFNPEPTRSKYFKTISYEGNNGWEVDSYFSDQTGQDPTVTPAGNWHSLVDQGLAIKSYLGGEYIMTTGSGTTVAASALTTVTLTSVTGVIPVGAPVTGTGVTAGTTVVSYNTGTGLLTVSQGLGVAEDAVLTFDYTIPRTLYNTALGTTQPSFPRYHAGFNRKENSYVANLVNNTPAMEAEVIFGSDISGVKGYYLTVKVSTDNVTNEGGEKQLFSVGTNYEMNNGY